MGRINVNLSIFAGLQSPNSSRVLLYAWLPLVVLNGAAWWCLVLPGVAWCCFVERGGIRVRLPKGLDKQVPLFFLCLDLGPCKTPSILAEGAIALSVTPSGGAQFAS